MIAESAGVTAAITGFVVAFALIPLVCWVALKLGILDRPGELKPHVRPTPHVAGLGVAAGVAAAVAMSRPWLLIPLAMALIIGLADDIRPLPPILRLAGQLAAGGGIYAVIPLRFDGPLGFILITVAAAALMNGFNFMDGLDGLCGSVALLTVIALSVIVGGDYRLLALACAGSVGAFLLYNMPPAQVYLGDGGAYLLGAVVTVLLASTWRPNQPLHTGLGGLTLVLLPLAEVALALVRRSQVHMSPLLGDRQHPYDQLVRRGWSHPAAVAAYAVTTLLLGITGVAAVSLRSVLALTALGSAVLALAALSLIARLVSPDLSGAAAPEPDIVAQLGAADQTDRVVLRPLAASSGFGQEQR